MLPETGRVQLQIAFEKLDGTSETSALDISYGKEMKFDYQEEDVFNLVTNTIVGFFEMFSHNTSYVDFHFDCTRRLWLDFRYNNDVSFLFLQECGVITKSDFPEPLNVQYAEYPPFINYKKFTQESKIAVSFSGGNESTLTMDILDKLRYNPTPFSIVKPRDFNACQVPRFKDRIHPVEFNITDIFSMLHPKMMKYEDIFLYMYVPLLLLVESVLVHQEGYEYLLVGDEFDCNFKLYTLNGLPVFSKNCYDQSNLFKRRMTQYMHDLGWNIQVLSILEPLYTTGILVLVDKYCPDEEKKYLFSCFYPVHEKDSVKPCNKCLKCKRIAGLIHSLKIDESKWGYKFDPEWRAGAEELFNSYGCQEEYEALNYRLQDMGYTGFGPEGKNYASATKVNVDPMWANIWLHLPTDVQKLISNDLYTFRSDCLCIA